MLDNRTKRSQAKSLSQSRQPLIELPFLEKYKEKISHVPKDGILKLIIPDSCPTQKSKVTGRRNLEEKENIAKTLNVLKNK
jgi:hypothetical protein